MSVDLHDLNVLARAIADQDPARDAAEPSRDWTKIDARPRGKWLLTNVGAAGGSVISDDFVEVPNGCNAVVVEFFCQGTNAQADLQVLDSDGVSTDFTATVDTSGNRPALTARTKVVVTTVMQRVKVQLSSISGTAPSFSVRVVPVNVATRVERTYQAPASGELAGATAATQLPNVPCYLAKLKAQYDNAGRVYLGVSSSVTKADGSTDITTGYQLNAGEETGWIPIDNLNRLWRIADNAGDDLTYVVMA